MLSVAEARARVLAGLSPTDAEIVPLAAAAGRVLAHPLPARRDQPAADVSAMDGYAVRAADAAVAGSRLAVVGAAPAGAPSPRAVGAGEAIRLFTGSVVPQGADAVLIQENATREDDRLTVDEPVAAGRHIRRRGSDFARGDVLIADGARLDARRIGLAAAGDHPHLAVRRRPRVALLATGDEIVLPGEHTGTAGLPSSNSFALAALLARAGAEPVLLPIARDDEDEIAAAALAARSCDMLVTTGGASVGDHDLVRSALARHGFAPDVWRIAMRPGKPLMHGAIALPGGGRVPVLGLPGNPVSALVCAALFLLPAIGRLLGRPDGEALRTRLARAGADLPANDTRFDHLRATVLADEAGALVATPFPVQDSGRLRDLANADALLLRPPHAPAAPAGTLVPVFLLADLGL